MLGISGGQDSTLTGRLASSRSTELREEGHDAEFVAVRLPYGVQADEHDAQIALEFIKPDRVGDRQRQARSRRRGRREALARPSGTTANCETSCAATSRPASAW